MADITTTYIIRQIFDQRGAQKFLHTQQKLMRTGDKLTMTTKKQGEVTKTVYKRTDAGLQAVSKSTVMAGQSMQKSGTMAMDFVRALKRVAVVVPIWFLFRQAMQGLLSTAKELFADLDKGMQKVMAVTQTYIGGQEKIYHRLTGAVKLYWATSARSMKEITEAMYQLGTAGRSAEEELRGFNHILNLAIGTFGNVADAGKTTAGILNVFEKDLQKFSNTSEKLRYISDLLAYTWQNNQVELNEIATAVGYAGSMAEVLDIDLNTLIGTIGTLNTGLLRGTKAGTSLMNAFVKISSSTDKLRRLGVIFDPRAPLDFRDVMEQIHNIYINQGKSLNFVGDLMEIFGRRGGRAILTIITQWEKWQKAIQTTPDDIQGTAEALKEIAEYNYPDLLKKAWRLMVQDITEFGGQAGESFGKNFLKNLIKELEEVQEVHKGIGLLKGLSEAMGISGTVNVEPATFYNWIKSSGLLEDAERYIDSLEKSHGSLKKIMDEGKAFATILKMHAKEGKKFADLTEREKEILASISPITANELSKAGELIDLAIERINAEAQVSAILDEQVQKASTLSSKEKQMLKDLENKYELRAMSVMQLDSTSIIYNKIERWTNNINENLKRSGKVHEDILDMTDVLALDYDKINNLVNNWTLGTAEVKEMTQLIYEYRLSMLKQQETMTQKLVNHELDLLKAQGASTMQILQTRMALEEATGIKQDAVSLLSKELELEKEISKEKEEQNNLSSETVQLWKIATRYGEGVATEMAEVLRGAKKIEDLSDRGKRLFRKQFTGKWEQAKAREYFFGGKGAEVPIGERPAPMKEVDITDRMRKLQARISEVGLNITIPRIDINIDINSEDINRRILKAIEEALSHPDSDLGRILKNAIDYH